MYCRRVCSDFDFPFMWVSAATDYGLESPGSIPTSCKSFFLSSTLPCPTQRPIQAPTKWVPRTLSPEADWLEREAYHPPPSNADANSGRAAWLAASLVNEKDNSLSSQEILVLGQPDTGSCKCVRVRFTAQMGCRLYVPDVPEGTVYCRETLSGHPVFRRSRDPISSRMKESVFLHIT
jgi:hypothetical protein